VPDARALAGPLVTQAFDRLAALEQTLLDSPAAGNGNGQPAVSAPSGD